MKTRNKKYNPNRVSAIRTKNTLAKYCIINVNNQGGLCRLSKLTGEEVQVSSAIHETLTLTRFNWSIYMAAFGINGSQNYTKSKIVISDKPYLQSELIERLNTEHQKILRGFNQSHLCGFGWIASPTGHDFSEAQAYDLFEKYGAFEELAA
jgi:hypothetical protein